MERLAALLSVAIFAGFTAVVGAYFSSSQRPGSIPDSQAQRQKRIDRLKSSLKDSADLLAEIDHDIAAGQARATEIQERVDRLSALEELTAEQTKAVGDLVAGAVSEGTRKSFWQAVWIQLVVGGVFFIAGVLVTLAAT